MTWAGVVDGANPGNVPRRTQYANQRWMPLEPCSRAQSGRVSYLLDSTGADAAEVFGAGFVDVGSLSSWAASWGISYLERLRSEQDAHDAEVKRLMGSVMREAMAEHPVRPCRVCDGDRSHRLESNRLVCDACGARP